MVKHGKIDAGFNFRSRHPSAPQAERNSGERKLKIPDEVLYITQTLEKAGFEAYVIGGCVRDLLLEKVPKDWDVTTNANPEQIQELFEETFYENDYGTVGVVAPDAKEESVRVIEVTPYRLEAKYSDSRHPDSVTFGKNLEEDLKRRDFTINAIAYSPSKDELVDLFSGREDLEKRTIRAVGEPKERFDEDALRILRAVRLAAELHFMIEPKTEKAIANASLKLDRIAKERIRDELIRILMSDKPMEGLLLAHKLGILKYIDGNLEQGIDVEQNQAHTYDVFEHNLRTLQHAADKNWPLDVRLASLFHDISKPETRRHSEEKKDWTFHGHDVVGARLAKKILANLKFPNKTIDKVVALVRWHMFFSDPEKVTLSAVRRTIRNVGVENIEDLLNLRICDRIGTGRPKEQPFRFRKYKSMVEEALRDPLSVSMLKIDGNKVMEITGEKPGPRIGFVLHALLDEVLDDPKRNTEEYLEKRTRELMKLQEAELKKLGEGGKETKEKAEEEEVKKIREKYWVK